MYISRSGKDWIACTGVTKKKKKKTKKRTKKEKGCKLFSTPNTESTKKPTKKQIIGIGNFDKKIQIKPKKNEPQE